MVNMNNQLKKRIQEELVVSLNICIFHFKYSAENTFLNQDHNIVVVRFSNPMLCQQLNHHNNLLHKAFMATVNPV